VKHPHFGTCIIRDSGFLRESDSLLGVESEKADYYEVLRRLDISAPKGMVPSFRGSLLESSL
jgi:hypothetical protein